MRRKIAYISGTRADFGLMCATLQALAVETDLAVIATGMHLSAAHGNTIQAIQLAGLRIAKEVPVLMEPATGATMARSLGQMITTFVDALEVEQPDLVLLLGDRGEMLAGAIAAIHLNIPVAHIHGGERSGTVDEPVRHAISKLAHIHLTATAEARTRLVKMGEDAKHIHVTGAPGLDGLTEAARVTKAQLAAHNGLDPAKPLALLVFHPVLQEAELAGTQIDTILRALVAADCQTLALLPNADAGSAAVRERLLCAQGAPHISVHTHLAREDFIAAMAAADVMIGNSSAGIIEAASFGTPVLNLGRRQNLRERNANVVDVPEIDDSLAAHIAAALAHGRFTPANVYGDGQTAQRIAALLSNYDLAPSLLMKVNGY